VSGCQTCGGYGMHHDPVAHDQQGDQGEIVTHADTLDRALRLLARSRRLLDELADEIRYDGPTLRVRAGMAADLANEITALIGHSVTDQPEAPEMFALREYLDDAAAPDCAETLNVVRPWLAEFSPYMPEPIRERVGSRPRRPHGPAGRVVRWEDWLAIGCFVALVALLWLIALAVST
jgi:hypothetical protein